jgi:hypothetical protein
MGANRIQAIQLSATWTAADLSFLVSRDGTTFFPLFDVAGAEVVLPSALLGANRFVGLSGAIKEALSAFQFVRLRSGTDASPVNQGNSTNLRLLVGKTPVRQD